MEQLGRLPNTEQHVQCCTELHVMYKLNDIVYKLHAQRETGVLPSPTQAGTPDTSGPLSQSRSISIEAWDAIAALGSRTSGLILITDEPGKTKAVEERSCSHGMYGLAKGRACKADFRSATVARTHWQRE